MYKKLALSPKRTSKFEFTWCCAWRPDCREGFLTKLARIEDRSKFLAVLHLQEKSALIWHFRRRRHRKKCRVHKQKLGLKPTTTEVINQTLFRATEQSVKLELTKLNISQSILSKFSARLWHIFRRQKQHYYKRKFGFWQHANTNRRMSKTVSHFFELQNSLHSSIHLFIHLSWIMECFAMRRIHKRKALWLPTMLAFQEWVSFGCNTMMWCDAM